VSSPFGDAQVGRINVGFGIALFLVCGVGMGIPLTINFLGGSLLTAGQYQEWKVVHGYGIFLGFINFFFGLAVDRLALTRAQKRATSWCFLLAGLCGAVARLILVLVGVLGSLGRYASLGETVFITGGTILFLLGQRAAAAVTHTATP